LANRYKRIEHANMFALVYNIQRNIEKVVCLTFIWAFKLFRDLSQHEYNTVGFPWQSTTIGHFKHWYREFPWVSAGLKYLKKFGQMYTLDIFDSFWLWNDMSSSACIAIAKTSGDTER
jgi:hypothetical protein